MRRTPANTRVESVEPDRRLLHWSSDPLYEIRDDRQDYERAVERLDKPNGLWVSVGDGEDGWRAWCTAESFHTSTMGNCTEIVLFEAANMLWLSCPADLDAFNSQYEVVGKTRHLSGINWTAVAADYDGIAIAPYIYERRFHDGYSWYYGWDCASGCIWNAAAVHSLEPLICNQTAFQQSQAHSCQPAPAFHPISPVVSPVLSTTGGM